jgi:hypothetical protein
LMAASVAFGTTPATTGRCGGSRNDACQMRPMPDVLDARALDDRPGAKRRLRAGDDLTCRVGVVAVQPGVDGAHVPLRRGNRSRPSAKSPPSGASTSASGAPACEPWSPITVCRCCSGPTAGQTGRRRLAREARLPVRLWIGDARLPLVDCGGRPTGRVPPAAARRRDRDRPACSRPGAGKRVRRCALAGRRVGAERHQSVRGRTAWRHSAQHTRGRRGQGPGGHDGGQ